VLPGPALRASATSCASRRTAGGSR
jgi:hypothetical protein